MCERHFERLGKAIEWHAGLSIDYFWNEATGRPSYIDANPRITEPMNAVVNGLNVADMQVRLSLGERTPPRASSTQDAAATTPSKRFWALQSGTAPARP